jgi:hypothetical protein
MARPEWMGPPEGWLPGVVPLQLELCRTPDLVVVLRAVEAYPTGAWFGLMIMSRTGYAGRLPMFMAPHAAPEAALRLGVQLADGRRAALGERLGHLMAHGQPPDGPVLTFAGGGGGSHHQMDLGLWLWPLPPRGDLTLGILWPDQGVSETLHVLDATAIVDAAARAEHLWDPAPVDPRGPMGRMGGTAAFGGSGIVGVAVATSEPAPPPDPDRPPDVTGTPPPDRDAAVAAIVAAFRHVHGGAPTEDAVTGIDDGADLVPAFLALRERATRFPRSVTTLDVVEFVDADHAVVHWSVHRVTPTPQQLASRLVRTADGWRLRRASVLQVLRLAGVPAPPD